MDFHFRKQKNLKRVFLNDPRTSDPYHRSNSPITAWAFIQAVRVGYVGNYCFRSFSWCFLTFTAFGHFFRRLHFESKASNKNIKCLQTSCCTIKSRHSICCCCMAHIWDVLFCAQWQMGVYIRLLSAQCQRLPSIKCFLKRNALVNVVL